MKDSLRKKIMLSLLDNGIIIPYIFNIYTEKLTYINITIQKLKNDNYIRERHFVTNKNKAKYKITYYSLTSKGLEYIRDKYSDDIPWLEYLPKKIPKFIHTQIRNYENLLKYLKSISVSLCLKDFDIETFKIYDIINVKGCTSIAYKTLINQARRDYAQDKMLNGQKASPKNIYIHAKDFAQYFKLSSEEANQYAFSNHTGVLLFRSNSYLIYSSEPQGLKILPIGTERYQNAIISFFKKTANLSENNCSHGIIFCKNQKEWVETFNKNMNRKKPYNLNNLFNYLYLLPYNKNMIDILKDIFNYKDDYYSNIINYLTISDTDFLYSNSLSYKGFNAEIGIDMNMVKLQKLYFRATSDERKDETFYLVCRTWQKEFYQKIMPDNVKYYICEASF